MINLILSGLFYVSRFRERFLPHSKGNFSWVFLDMKFASGFIYLYYFKNWCLIEIRNALARTIPPR